MAIGLAAVALIAVAAWTQDVAGLRYPPATIQRIRLPQFEMGLASRDGRYMPYVDSAGDLQLWERRTGQSARVTGHRVGEAILMPLMSPRGDRVVYTLQTADGAFELAAVNVDGTSPAVLLSRQTAYTPKPVDWSRDGRDILCLLDQRNRSIDLVLVPAAGGSPSVIHTVQNQVPFHPTLSPDGRFVAYAFTPEQPSQQRDIFIIATTPGASPRPLIAGVANDSGPVWAPDGRSIFFLRESSEHPGESQDGWIFPVSNGAASGEARLVLSNLGPVDLGPMPGLTLADDGTLFYQRTMRSAEINTLSADLTGAVAPGPPTRIEPGSIGDHVAPSWSPDGNSIAYLRTLESPSGGTPLRTLTIKDMVDGRTRQLSPSIPSLGGYKPRWLPDGRSVIVWGWSDDNKVYGYYRVDVRTGRTSMVVGAEKSHWPHPGSFETDGRSFFYSGLGGIVARDLSSGDERIVVPLGDRDEIGRFGLSPNGQVVAFVSTVVSHGTAIYRLEAQTVGGTLRELWRTTEPLRFQTWMPDGRDVLVTNKPTAPNALAQLWRVPTAGGDRRDMHFAIIGNVDNPLSLNPDGRRLAYTERDSYAELVVRQRFWDSREVRKKRWP
jgi:Tol biopolymer transport system component